MIGTSGGGPGSGPGPGEVQVAQDMGTGEKAALQHVTHRGGLVRSPHYDPLRYRPHALHSPERTWVETNCYVDLWIELLNILGLPPEPAGVGALGADAMTRGWTFLKVQTDDVRRLYGIRVSEELVWRSVAEHVADHLEAGHLLTLETDAWFLPDTEGTSYRTSHEKTSIVPVEIDLPRRALTYLHNAGRFRLHGDDFDGALARDVSVTQVPHPYMEVVRVPPTAPDRARLVAATLEAARDHLDRAPHDNPVQRLSASLQAELPELQERGMPYFHTLSFATTRQLGLTAQSAADVLGWLADEGVDGADSLRVAAAGFARVSAQAKALQFSLARVASGRRRDLAPALGALTAEWGEAMSAARSALAA